MDPNPKKYPFLSYVMVRVPYLGPKLLSPTKSSTTTVSDHHDIEQPPVIKQPAVIEPPSPSITDRFPQLKDPQVLASMTKAVSEVAQTRSILQTLGPRPDHEAVDAAKSQLQEIESELSGDLEEIALSPRMDNADKEAERRNKLETDRLQLKSLIQLDEMHASYEKLLKDAEIRLVKIYENAQTMLAQREGGNNVNQQDDGDELINEEVIGILQDASGKGVERVDISGRRLRILPEAFGKISCLRVLNISNNQLEIIPDSIAGLEHLEELNASSNLLESLPDSIGLLLNMKKLDVSSNKLNSLPDSIAFCKSLVELNVSFNRLTYLPTNIGYELTKLQKFSIHLNKIRSIPSSIGEMRSLRVIDAHFNELNGLPLAIGRLTNLETLNLSSNFSDLKELPDTIGDLSSLRELDLSNNQIHALPITFGRLDNLTKLNLDQNPFEIPPMEVVKQGVEAVKAFMAQRWLDILMEEERKSQLEGQEQGQTGWLSRSYSSLKSYATEYLASPKAAADPYLDRQM
ncbi:hypothetical protein ACFE04_031336 [Oxalis oulophora]